MSSQLLNEGRRMREEGRGRKEEGGRKREEGGEMKSERLEMRNEGGRKKFANTRKWMLLNICKQGSNAL